MPKGLTRDYARKQLTISSPEPAGMLGFASPRDSIRLYGCASPELFYQIREEDSSQNGDKKEFGFSITLDRDFALRAAVDLLSPEAHRVFAQRLSRVVEDYGMKSPTMQYPCYNLFAAQTSSVLKCGLLRSLTANPQGLSTYLSHHDNLKLVTPIQDLAEDPQERWHGNPVYTTAGSVTKIQADALKEMFKAWVDLEMEHLALK